MHCSKLDLVIRLHEQKRTHSCATTYSKITVLFLFQISDVRLLETVNRIFTLNLYIYISILHYPGQIIDMSVYIGDFID